MALKRMIALAFATVMAFGLSAPAAFAEPTGYTSPSTVRAGEHFTVFVNGCDSGSASVSLTRIGGPSNVGLEADKGKTQFQGRFQVPVGVAAARYALGGTCGDGSGFVVMLTVAPRGAPATGVAPAPADDGTNLAAVGVIAALAIAGGVALRRSAWRRRSIGG